MLLKTARLTPAWHMLIGSGLVLLFGLAIGLRVSLYHIETSDYTFFLNQWYIYIQSHGGLAALKNSFSNYNTPYLTLLALTTYLPIPELIAIKTLSVIFDGVLAVFVYLILRLKYGRGLAALAGALVLLFAPTIFINSAAWGQCDAIYTSFCLGSLYYLLKRRPGWACVFFGLALAFKLQAVFFAPVLLLLLLKRTLPLRYLVLIPLIFLLMLTPALIAGRSIESLLSIYAQQISGNDNGGNTFNNSGASIFNSGSSSSLSFIASGHSPSSSNRSDSFTASGPGGSGPSNGNGPGGSGSPNGGPTNAGQGNGGTQGGFGQGNSGGGLGRTSSSSSLTLNAPNFYQWLPSDAPTNYWKWVGIALAGLFVLALGVLLLLSKQQLTPAILLKSALAFALVIPFLLPEMHERYFYLADVISILYAFYFPRIFYVAIITQLCSLLSYTPYFQQTQIVPLSYVAVAELIGIIIVLIDLVRVLYLRAKPMLPIKDEYAAPVAASVAG